MFEADNIREWRGHDVVDSEGKKIGSLESIYVDTVTDRPAFAAVTIGMPTRRRLVFVPLDRSTVGPGYLKVTYDRSRVKDAPGIDIDGELFAEAERDVFTHYDLPYEQGSRGERRLARR
ncbi:PRC-barrel domain-containing protein [Streptomyces sp. SCSIO 75703]|uniref:PRC-barrel domain-containing protein n=1 Tax=unclassified Streptomyces TaxID=2593676 RepID=UPI0004BFB6D3|nr:MULTISPECIES: PRC-barrel domain-containing protein [unclassified Streptomyces]